MKNVILSLILVLLLMSCFKDNTNLVAPIIEVKNATELQPLKVGNEWIYTSYSHEGPNIDTTSFKRYVSGTIVRNNLTYYLFKQIDFKTNETYEIAQYLSNFFDGLYLTNKNDGVVTKYNYPTNKGDIIYDSNHVKIYVEETEFVYNSNGKKYKCIKYVETFQNNDNLPIFKTCSYFTPGVGLIAFEIYSVNSNIGVLSYKIQLKSYSLK